MPKRHFDFLCHPYGGYARPVSMRIGLGEAATLECIEQLFCDLYMQLRVRPRYLFMERDEAYALIREFRSQPLPYRYWGFDFYSARQIFSEAIGQAIHIIEFPDLEKGCVIVGFINERD